MMARYGRDAEKHVFSFMDGVPVKISEQFKPPRKVGLPAGYQQRLTTESVSEEFDFSLENSVLEKIGEWRKLRKSATEYRKERVKAQNAMDLAEKQTSLKVTSSSLDSSTTNIPSSSVSPIPNNIVTYSMHPTENNSSFNTDNSSILTPVQIAHPASEPENSLITHFNLSDFEADTSSPFDNMELKTINEMEVLAHVLQPLSHSPSSKKCEQPPSNTIHSKAEDTHKLNIDKDLPKNGSVSYTKHNVYNSDSGVYNFGSDNAKIQGAYDFYPRQVWSVGDGEASTLETDQQPSSLEHLKICHSSHSPFPTNTFSNSQSIPIQHISQVDQDDCYSSNSKPVDVGNFTEYYCPTFPPPNQGADRSQSKSVPDIVHELDKELMCKELNRRSGNSPRPNSFGSVGLENWKPWPDLDSPEHLHPCLKKPPSSYAACAPSQVPKSTLPNPFDDLSPSLQLLSTHISDMGFALPRVARACQAVGPDDKKVVEYLLQIQSLEDENYPGDRAERALVANDFDRAKTVAHLDAMEQLLGLGFKEQQVFDALVRFDNDRDKALDHLIS